MGERTDRDEERPEDAWQAIVEHGESHPGHGLEEHSRRLREAGPFPPSYRRTALIVDTDVGGDPDDALALAVAAIRMPELGLVVTSDERGGERARFARHLLDALGRPEVPVVAGAQVGEARAFCVEDLVPESVPRQPAGVVDAVGDLCDRVDGPLRWVGMGPTSNLAAVLDARPALAGRLRVTQMGGALRYRDPERAEHNFRLDAAAATAVLGAAREPWLVTSDVTFTPETEVTAESPLYRMLAEPDAPAWAATLRAHLDRWFARFHPGSMQHDALTLSAAAELPFVEFSFTNVALDDLGRMRLDPAGPRVFLSRKADYPAFMRWLTIQLGPITTPSQP
jgi:inosine-uridine nucleoside N-ribohydrolase